MRAILQRKMMLVVWLAMMVSLGISKADVTVSSATELIDYLNSKSNGNFASLSSDGYVVLSRSTASVPTDVGTITINGGDIKLITHNLLSGTIALKGGNLSFSEDYSGIIGNMLCDIELYSGKLNVIVPRNDFIIEKVKAHGGEINLSDGSYINHMMIKDIEVYGNTEITGLRENSSSDYFPLCENMKILPDAENVILNDTYIAKTLEISGNTILDNVGCFETTINSGEIEIKNFSSERYEDTSTGTIIQKGGNVKMWNVSSKLVRVDGGELTIDGNPWLNPGVDELPSCQIPCVHVNGEDSKVTFLNGEGIIFREEETGSDVRLSKGELIIKDGEYRKIYAEGGKLSISGGIFTNIYIAKPTEVTLTGGRFKGSVDNTSLPALITISDDANMKPEDLLGKESSFFANSAFLQPNHIFSGTDIIAIHNDKNETIIYAGAIDFTKKATSEIDNWYEAALKANVGAIGTDVEIKNNVYIIKSEVGLAWVSQILNHASIYIWDSSAREQYKFGLVKDNPYVPSDKASFILAKDLNMSSYYGKNVDWGWIPFSLEHNQVFDGQGHTISGLKMEQSTACFIYNNKGLVKNIRLKGNVNIIADEYHVGDGYGAGFIMYNSGKIINCGYEGNITANSILSTNMGGFVYDNGGEILNSYMSGNVTGAKTGIGAGTDIMRIGGFVSDNDYGVISNCYKANKTSYTNGTNKKNYIITVADFDCSYEGSSGQKENYYTENEIELDLLNENVKQYNEQIEDETITQWSKWKIDRNENNGFPIHGENIPTIIESYFTLRSEGEGEFKAIYYTLKDETDPESQEEHIIYADTTVTFTSAKTVKLVANPAENYELEKVVKVSGEKETPLDVEFIPGEEVNYNVAVSDTLKAYFKLIEIIPEPEPEVITTDSVLTATQVNGKDLVVDNDKEEYLELEASGIDVSSLTINAGSSAVLELSGTNDLGTVTNNGTLIVQNVNGSLNAAIQNNGTFTDYTGKVTEVEGNASLSIEPITDNANDGETVTLVATAIADGTVSFQWQRQEDDGSWTNIEQTELMTRAMMLRAASEQTDELIVPLSEAGWYRCLITYKKGNTSTTLVAYAEVSDDGEVEEPENPEEDNPNLPDYPDYYNIYIETCEGVKATLSTKIVREGNSMTFTLETEEGYTDENITVKFKRSMFGYWETATPDEKGVYQIHNIYADIYITVEGVEEENPTGIEEIGGIKVYAKDGSIYVQTPKQEQVLIISISGAIVKNEKQVGLQRYDGLQRGVYVVKVGKQVFKTRN